MNILIVGQLWPNEDRILALSSLGHKVVYGYVGFSRIVATLEPHITCVSLARRMVADQVSYLVSRYEIDVIYCLLNYYDGSTEVAIDLLDSGISTPIVRHYKEHPYVPQDDERRTLMETAGQIYINEHSYEYFRQVYGVHSWSAHIMDADMIAARYMTDQLRPKLRVMDGEPHLLVAGNLTMINDRQDARDLCAEMARRRTHVHLYCKYIGMDRNGFPIRDHAPTRQAYERLSAALPYVHLHDFIKPDEFTQVWSVYDAGVMHSKVPILDLEHQPDHVKGGTGFTDLYRSVRFEKMNYPYRYSSYLAAGLPLAIPKGCQDAMEALAKRDNIGLIFEDYDDLVEQLLDVQHMSLLTENAVAGRKSYSFDSQVPHLVEILTRYSK